MPCNLVRQFHVLQFHVRHFQRPLVSGIKYLEFPIPSWLLKVLLLGSSDEGQFTDGIYYYHCKKSVKLLRLFASDLHRQIWSKHEANTAREQVCFEISTAISISICIVFYAKNGTL